MNSSVVYFFPIFSSGLFYSEYRTDPIFPAIYSEPNDVPPESVGRSQYFFSNATQLDYLACVDRRQICEGDTTTCRDLPDRDSFFRTSDPEKVTEADMAFALVAVALSASSLNEAMPLWYNLEIRSHCTDSRCSPLPREQWKVEARRLFQASLARIQVELVNTVRGAVNTVYAAPGYSMHEYEISEEYRGMCGMGKYKNVGWRNVSVWGVSGLLFLAASISLASVQTKGGRALAERFATHRGTRCVVELWQNGTNATEMAMAPRQDPRLVPMEQRERASRRNMEFVGAVACAPSAPLFRLRERCSSLYSFVTQIMYTSSLYRSFTPNQACS